jgi:hypothetical protein
MSSDRERQFGSYARDCVKAAELADTQELRERLLQMAREWMQACMEEEDNRNGLRGSATSPEREARVLTADAETRRQSHSDYKGPTQTGLAGDHHRNRWRAG